jgi:hypothetical protein
MSQVQYQPVAQPQSSGLGIAAFICSLVGLVTGGLLCPIGLILGLVALGRRPRGFAIAAVIIGFLGTCGGLLIVIFAFGVVVTVLAAIGIAFALTDAERMEVTSDMIMAAAAVGQYEDREGNLPDSLDELDLTDSAMRDPWGNAYRLVLDDSLKPGFDLVSAGQDGEFDTDDDIRLSRLDDYWHDAFSDFEQRMEQLEREGGIRYEYDVHESAEEKPEESPAQGVAEPAPAPETPGDTSGGAG